VCEIVTYIHQRGIVHRDIKPANVLVLLEDGKPLPRLIDFGIAQTIFSETAGSMEAESQQIFGTIDYMSPEQSSIDCSRTDERSDIYARGGLLYELLTGKTPFEEWRGYALKRQIQVLHNQMPIPLRQRSIVGNELDASTVLLLLDDITMKCLSRLPANRYQSTTELLTGLDTCQRQLAVPLRPGRNAGRLRRILATSISAVVLLMFSLSPLGNSPRTESAVTDSQTEQVIRIDGLAYQQITEILRDNGVETRGATVTIAAETNKFARDAQATQLVTLIPAVPVESSHREALLSGRRSADGHSG
jgi:serine/threonine protein kinase